MRFAIPLAPALRIDYQSLHRKEKKKRFFPPCISRVTLVASLQCYGWKSSGDCSPAEIVAILRAVGCCVVSTAHRSMRNISTWSPHGRTIVIADDAIDGISVSECGFGHSNFETSCSYNPFWYPLDCISACHFCFPVTDGLRTREDPIGTKGYYSASAIVAGAIVAIAYFSCGLRSLLCCRRLHCWRHVHWCRCLWMRSGAYRQIGIHLLHLLQFHAFASGLDVTNPAALRKAFPIATDKGLWWVGIGSASRRHDPKGNGRNNQWTQEEV